MLVSRLEDVHKYLAYTARFEKAFTWLRTADLASLPLGVHIIDGDRITANIQEFDTVSSSEKAYEAHRRYADIHYVIAGEELVSIAHVSQVQPLQAFDEQADFCLYSEPASCMLIPLQADEFVVAYPEDAHKPGCALTAPSHIRKVCIKVLVSD